MVPGAYGLVATLDRARGDLYGQIVAQAGLDPVVTRDGASAEQTLRDRGAPGLVLTELSLPRTDGFKLLGALRAVAGPDESPAVVVSGFAELRLAAERLKDRLGIAAVLARSASFHAVDRAVKRALERDRGRPPERPRSPTRPSRPARPAVALAQALRAHDAEAFTAVALEARRVLGVPIAVVALAAGDRVVVPARVGIDAELPELLLFCREVADAEDVLVVPDTSDHPLFTGRPALLRGYAAAPVMTARGDVAGVLCVADDQPLALGAAELDVVAVYARRVAGELEAQVALPPATTLALEEAPPLAAVLRHLADGVAVLGGGRILYANDALADMVEVSPHKLEGMDRDTFVGAIAAFSAAPEVTAQRLRVVPGGVYAGRADLELTRPERRVLRWTARPVPLGDGLGLGQLELFADVTAAVDLGRERELFARTDWLTGLMNRRGGEDAIAREVARARRLASSLCFTLFDVDGLQGVNDLHGFAVGDEIIRELARVVRGAVRGSDLAIRWGGDELLVALPGIPEAGARVFAERVRKRVAALALEGRPRITVSAGVSELSKFEDASAAIGRADARMFQAKRDGRNRIA
jgi:diguanylate cyclase (GGDEF)-like protein